MPFLSKERFYGHESISVFILGLAQAGVSRRFYRCRKRNWFFIDATAESIIAAGMIKNNIVLPVISCPDNIIAGAKSNALNLSGLEK